MILPRFSLSFSQTLGGCVWCFNWKKKNGRGRERETLCVDKEREERESHRERDGGKERKMKQNKIEDLRNRNEMCGVYDF